MEFRVQGIVMISVRLAAATCLQLIALDLLSQFLQAQCQSYYDEFGALTEPKALKDLGCTSIPAGQQSGA